MRNWKNEKKKTLWISLWSSSCMVLSWKTQNITIQIQVAGILFRLEANIQTTLNSSSPKPGALRYLPRDGRVITPRRKVLISYHGLTTPHDQHLVNKARLQKLIEWNAKLERWKKWTLWISLWSSSCMVLSWKAQNITIQIQVAGILFRLEEHIQSTLNSSSPKPRALRYLPRHGRVIT